MSSTFMRTMALWGFLGGLLWMLYLPLKQNNRNVLTAIAPIINELPTTPAKKLIKKPEKPLHNVTLPDFAHIKDVREKKRQFFQFLTPAIRKVNQRIAQQREKLLALQAQDESTFTPQQIKWLNQLAKRYRISSQLSLTEKLNELLVCVDQVPEELVLVQAANESAWGTSRFARIGLNFFGIWCYQPKCGMIPNGRSGNDKHEVAAFKSVEQAVSHYFYNINTHKAYKVFREIRRQLRAENHPLKAEILASGLLAYSQRGEHYVIEITKMIEQNRAYFTPSNEEQMMSEE